MPFFGPLGDRGNQQITILEHRIGEKQEKIGPEAMPETNSIFHCFWDAERRSGQVKAELPFDTCSVLRGFAFLEI